MSVPSIPLADGRDLSRPARRTTGVRIGLLVLAAALGAGCVVAAARLEVGESSVLGPGATGVVVLDLSSSTESAPPREIPGVLRHLANAGGHSGLVLFSDASYEALPAGAASEELRPFLRYFRRPPAPPVGVGRVAVQPRPARLQTPWSRSFRSGTRISAGLAEARRMILDEPGAGREVLLVSDLNDSLFDITALEQELRRYRSGGIRLRIVALQPTVENRGFFASRVGQAAFVDRTSFTDGLTGRVSRPTDGFDPWALVVLIVGLAAALAAGELLCTRLQWGRA